MRRALPILLTLLTGSMVLAQSVDRDEPLSAILARVGAAVQRYYATVQSVMCTETVTQQTVGRDLAADAAFPRRLVYDLRVAWEPAEDGTVPKPRVHRVLMSANGRAPRPKDKPQCTDPASGPDGEGESDRLEFLLPGNHHEFVFSRDGQARINGRMAIVLDYRPREKGKPYAERKDGIEGCFSVHTPGFDAGRLWIDRETSDVLRIDQRTAGQVTVRVPPARRWESPLDVTLERNDISTVYRPVTFSDPQETVLLPSSSETLVVFRGPVSAGRRETHRFTNYQRFSTGGRLVPHND